MQQSHLSGALSRSAKEASATPIVPAQRAPFTLTRPKALLIDRLSRPGARCRDCSWPVFPRPLAAPGVPVSGHRALHGSCRSGVVEGPGAGDRAAAVAVPGDRHGFEVEQLDPVCRDWLPPPVWGGEGPADVFPPPAVQRPER